MDSPYLFVITNIIIEIRYDICGLSKNLFNKQILVHPTYCTFCHFTDDFNLLTFTD